ncbi:pentapeptide repeat-containing protein [Aliarcobacter butzleri]|uniref:pentapeptide repeat-containing protein n=1 Tax=Aliarcobacter butzleri TaxID=28197 RepID=UPI003AE9B97A
MNKCSCGNCDLEVFENSDKCIFHCEKDENFLANVSYVKDYYEKFYSFIIEISEKRKEYFKNSDIYYEMDEKDLKKYEIKDFIFPSFKNKIFLCLDGEYNESVNLLSNRTEKNIDIKFENCKFLGKFDLSKETINFNLIFKNCVFEKYSSFEETIFNNKFKLIDCQFKEFVSFKRTKFNELAGFEKTKFNKVIFRNTRFKKTARFINTEFNNISFEYTYFDSIVVFNELKVKENINLEKTIFSKYPNFHKIECESISNRETARIIKDSFEQQNNIIEANKFYALEMEKREKELDFKKDFFEWLVFKIHSLSSNHSQDWTLALFWIINLTFFYSYLNIQPNDKILVFKIFFSCIAISVIACMTIKIPEENKERRWLTTIPTTIVCYGFYGYLVETDWQLSEFSKNLNPFSIMRGDEPITLGTLIFKIIIAYLIYQLIISIRQNTRRK